MDSLAGGGVGRLDRGTQLARYLSSSSSVMSLLMERAGEKSILLLFVQRLLCVLCFFLFWSYSVRGDVAVETGCSELCGRRERANM